MKQTTAARITQNLLSWAKTTHYDLVIPNLFYGPYEMDVFRLSKNMYVTEFEVKVSEADFQRDFKKGGGCKHDRLRTGVDMMPNRFFFVVPVSLAAKIIVPAHLGLLSWDENRPRAFTVLQHAKILHKGRPHRDIYIRLAQNLAAREQTFREKCNMLNDLLQKKNEQCLIHFQHLTEWQLPGLPWNGKE